MLFLLCIDTLKFSFLIKLKTGIKVNFELLLEALKVIVPLVLKPFSFTFAMLRLGKTILGFKELIITPDDPIFNP